MPTREDEEFAEYCKEQDQIEYRLWEKGAFRFSELSPEYREKAFVERVKKPTRATKSRRHQASDIPVRTLAFWLGMGSDQLLGYAKLGLIEVRGWGRWAKVTEAEADRILVSLGEEPVRRGIKAMRESHEEKAYKLWQEGACGFERLDEEHQHKAFLERVKKPDLTREIPLDEAEDLIDIDSQISWSLTEALGMRGEKILEYIALGFIDNRTLRGRSQRKIRRVEANRILTSLGSKPYPTREEEEGEREAEEERRAEEQRRAWQEKSWLEKHQKGVGMSVLVFAIVLVAALQAASLLMHNHPLHQLLPFCYVADGVAALACIVWVLCSHSETAEDIRDGIKGVVVGALVLLLLASFPLTAPIAALAIILLAVGLAGVAIAIPILGICTAGSLIWDWLKSLFPRRRSPHAFKT